MKKHELVALLSAEHPRALGCRHVASYESRFSVRQLVDAFSGAGVELAFPGGAPNIEPRDEVRPTDPDRAVRASSTEAGRADYTQMRFGFPPPAPKRPPIINFRSEGRRFSNGEHGGRCLIPVSGFYEFTGDKYPKTRWKLSVASGEPFPRWRRSGEAGRTATPSHH